MKVLFAVSEAAPIVKLGGLGDVAGSLPKALEHIGVDVDVVIPFYPLAKVQQLKVYKSIDINVPFGGNSHLVEVFNTKLPGSDVDVLLLKNPHFFSLGGKNAFSNTVSETEMFTFFNRAVVELVKSRFNTYDLIHCNDWHTGLITHLLEDELSSTRPATLFTIHNLLYQGVGGLELVSAVGLVPGMHDLIDWDIQDGDINLMLQGITSSDYVNTVSPSYAKEIMTSKFGGGLDAILKAKEGRVVGVLNGIDYGQFPRNYDIFSFKKGKSKIKQTLQEKMSLAVCDKPVFAFISRLDPGQKGLDILLEAIPIILDNGGQFILLGTGDPTWEQKFKTLGNTKDLSINIAFDVDLARLIYSGSDFLIVPSKYEPCGLIQMIAMWYGTLPVVHAVGGLKDSVEHRVTGITFAQYTPKALAQAVQDALDVYKDLSVKEQMIKNAMSTNFSWDSSAKEYAKLYERIVKLRKLAVELASD